MDTNLIYSINVSHCKYCQVNFYLLDSSIFADLRKKIVGSSSVLGLN